VLLLLFDAKTTQIQTWHLYFQGKAEVLLKEKKVLQEQGYEYSKYDAYKVKGRGREWGRRVGRVLRIGKWEVDAGSENLEVGSRKW
jgi:hypothetical protein